MITEQTLKRLRNMLDWREQRLDGMEECATKYHVGKEVEALREALSVLEAQDA